MCRGVLYALRNGMADGAMAYECTACHTHHWARIWNQKALFAIETEHEASQRHIPACLENTINQLSSCMREGNHHHRAQRHKQACIAAHSWAMPALIDQIAIPQAETWYTLTGMKRIRIPTGKAIAPSALLMSHSRVSRPAVFVKSDPSSIISIWT